MNPKYCPYCGLDELKKYKNEFYCCYGCGKIVSIEIATQYNNLKTSKS